MINRTCWKIHFFFDFSKKIWRVFSDNARELYFLIIRMQKSNNFIRKRMGKILSKTRSNWLPCLAWNFVMTRGLWVKVSCKCDLSYFCKKKLLGSTESIFSIEEWVVFMTHQFNSICCIFCDLHGCHLIATLWSLLSDFTSTSFKNTYPLCIKTSSQNLCLNYDFQ